MAAGRHRRRLSRWTRVRQALAGAVVMSAARGRHRNARALAAEVARLTGEVAELRATAARLRSEVAVASAQVATARLAMDRAEADAAVARAEAETAKKGHRLALERLRAEVEHNAEAAAAARAASTLGADLKISLLLPLVQAAMARSQGASAEPAPATAATPELAAFPRVDSLEEIVAADQAIASTIDLRHGRHAKVA